MYARLTRKVLTNAGYRIESWSSSLGNHSWNQVIMPDSRILYTDATWYDNCWENHPASPNPDGYSPWYITYDKDIFENGFRRTIRMHGAWSDARKIE